MWAQRQSSRQWKKLREQIPTETNEPLWIGDHTAIVTALKLRNADAAYKAMARHISNVANELLEADDRGRFGEEGE
jgi:DNA-binding FadR family transcriptional regulator